MIIGKRKKRILSVQAISVFYRAVSVVQKLRSNLETKREHTCTVTKPIKLLTDDKALDMNKKDHYFVLRTQHIGGFNLHLRPFLIPFVSR